MFSAIFPTIHVGMGRGKGMSLCPVPAPVDGWCMLLSDLRFGMHFYESIASPFAFDWSMPGEWFRPLFQIPHQLDPASSTQLSDGEKAVLSRVREAQHPRGYRTARSAFPAPASHHAARTVRAHRELPNGVSVTFVRHLGRVCEGTGTVWWLTSLGFLGPIIGIRIFGRPQKKNKMLARAVFTFLVEYLHRRATVFALAVPGGTAVTVEHKCIDWNCAFSMKTESRSNLNRFSRTNYCSLFQCSAFV